MTVKRTPKGDLFLAVVVDGVEDSILKFKTSKAAGFDFGLKVFLTISDGTKIESPEFFKQSVNLIRKAPKNLSSKKKGSANWERALKNLCRRYEDITHQRTDWFWKLAHQLTDQYDLLCFENLNLKGMQRLWGKKIQDLAFAEFLQILQWVAKKKDQEIVFIDRWYPSSKTCSNCKQINESLELSDRFWRCLSCNTGHDRDENAAVNILNVGASTFRLGDVSQVCPAIPV